MVTTPLLCGPRKEGHSSGSRAKPLKKPTATPVTHLKSFPFIDVTLPLEVREELKVDGEWAPPHTAPTLRNHFFCFFLSTDEEPPKPI